MADAGKPRDIQSEQRVAADGKCPRDDELQEPVSVRDWPLGARKCETGTILNRTLFLGVTGGTRSANAIMIAIIRARWVLIISTLPWGKHTARVR